MSYACINDTIFTASGSLINDNQEVLASYDLEAIQGIDLSSIRPLSDLETNILNASVKPFYLDYKNISNLNIINGMGVALGDSVIGISAINAIRRHYPHLNIKLWRPSSAPNYVEEIYHLSPNIIGEINYLPNQLEELLSADVVIDIGNHFYWPKFNELPMIDFFLSSLGVNHNIIAKEDKDNSWLKKLDLPNLPNPWNNTDYLLFCPQATTPIRSIPRQVWGKLMQLLQSKFSLPILGFEEFDYPGYINIGKYSPDTATYLSWIKNAKYLVAGDSSAIHIAAGYSIPSLAFFSTIDPYLRVGNYPKCNAIKLNLPTLKNIHASSDTRHLEMLLQAYYQSLKLL